MPVAVLITLILLVGLGLVRRLEMVRPILLMRLMLVLTIVRRMVFLILVLGRRDELVVNYWLGVGLRRA